MRRVMVIGPPGSGKSTFARRLGARLGLPVFHLDQVFWRAGWVQAPPDEVRAQIDRIASLPAWIAEGNYLSWSASRLARADTLVYLDVPAWLSLVRLLGRIARGYGRVRPDLSPGCPERLDTAFLHFAWTWNRRERRRHLDLAAAFAGRAVVLAGRQPSDAPDRL